MNVKNFSWTLAALLLISLKVSCEELCRQIDVFNALCKRDGILYILSANPCSKEKSVGVTVVNMDTKTLSSYNVTSSSRMGPIPIHGRPGKAILVARHPIPDSNGSNARFHVMLYTVDIDGHGLKKSDRILEVKFYMLTEGCSFKTLDHTHVKDPFDRSCTDGLRLGEYSSICIVTNQSSHLKTLNVEPGVYIVNTGVCTVPYSATVIAFKFSGPSFIQTFTQDKTDEFFALSPTDANCGLKLVMHDHYGETIHSLLSYGCGEHAVTLMNVYDHTHFGLICPLSNCTSLTPVSKSCFVPWIYAKDETRLAHIKITLDLCRPELFNALFHVYLHDEVGKNFPFTLEKELVPGVLETFRIGLPLAWKNISTDNGYLYLDGGHISLFTTENDGLYVSVLRQYPKDTDRIPLFHTKFTVNKEDYCPSDNSAISLKIGLSVAGAAALIFIVVVATVYLCRYRYRNRADGLPYQIHLSDSFVYDDTVDGNL